MNYRDILRETGIEILWMPPDYSEKGTYLPACPEFPKGAVMIKITLSPIETECVILHEIGHLLEGSVLSKLSAPQLHIINESKANRFTVQNVISEWLETLDGNYEYATAERFCASYKLDIKEYGLIAEQEIKYAMEIK